MDERRIAQVMVNLLSNAAKFSQSGGQGILPEMKEKVFETFTQGDNSDTHTPGGAGLGLSISKSIVERHGGEFDFGSAYGERALFFYDLPMDG